MSNWYTKNNSRWQIPEAGALWDDAVVTWDALLYAWDAAFVVPWYSKNNSSFYTEN